MNEQHRRRQISGLFNQAPIPGLLSSLETDLEKDGVILALASVGTLVAAGRMSKLESKGQGMDAIENVILGMMLYGVLDHVRRTGTHQHRRGQK